MDVGHLSRKHYLLTFALVFVAVAFALMFALCAAIDRRLFSNSAIVGVVGGVVATWVPIAFGIFIAIYYMPRPPRQLNYPRIEHLRIAGKYAPTSASKIGVSPLHLR
jgi:hypothetical protein